nr:hypothetical protein [Tolivirales sp.]
MDLLWFVRKPPPPPPPSLLDVVGSTVGRVIGRCLPGLGLVAICYGGYRAIARGRRDKVTADTVVGDMSSFLASAAEYEPSSREVCDGESPDFTEVEDVITEKPSAEEGGQPVRVRERRVVKKKWVHDVLSAGVVDSPYLAEVVQEARLHYNHREATPYNMGLAKAFMVRTMKGHGLRPAHIAANIDDMVLAVFLITDAQARKRDTARLLRSAGRLGGYHIN